MPLNVNVPSSRLLQQMKWKTAFAGNDRGQEPRFCAMIKPGAKCADIDAVANGFLA